jgi:hypothetical protein
VFGYGALSFFLSFSPSLATLLSLRTFLTLHPAPRADSLSSLQGDDFPLDRLLPSPTSTANSSLSPSTEDDRQHLTDAVDALDQLESDIGSISLTSPLEAPTTLDTTSRARSLSIASASSLAHRTRAGSLASSAAPPAVLEEEEDSSSLGLHSVANCVLRFLESLEEPVVTYELYGRAIAAERREEAYGVVQELPESVRVSLSFLFLSTI